MTRWLRVDLLSQEFEGERLIGHAGDFCTSSESGAAGVAAARPSGEALLSDCFLAAWAPGANECRVCSGGL